MMQPQGPRLRIGEYIVSRAADTPAERLDCINTLRRNGCKSVRFEQMDDGRLQAHGYLAVIAGADPT